jgi:hypothetical protein
MTLAVVRKFIVAAVGAAVILLDGFGVNVDQDTLDGVVAVLTAIAVYLVPNG